MLDLIRSAFAIVHVGAGAVWLGAMVYSLVVVQPRAARFFRDAEQLEDFTVVLASGARWKVLGVAAAVALSGAGLVATEIAGNDDATALWSALVVAKGVLLVIAVALFWYVSWRLWPARQLAHAVDSPDLPTIQGRFRKVALALTAVVAAGLVLGAIADAVRQS